jgi:hypothetical protein
MNSQPDEFERNFFEIFPSYQPKQKIIVLRYILDNSSGQQQYNIYLQNPISEDFSRLLFIIFQEDNALMGNQFYDGDNSKKGKKSLAAAKKGGYTEMELYKFAEEYAKKMAGERGLEFKSFCQPPSSAIDLKAVKKLSVAT